MINEEIIRNTYMGPISIVTPIPITFSFDQKQDVKVFKVTADGIGTTLSYGSGYTVDDSKNLFITSPTVTEDSITVYRVSARDQQRDFVEDGRYRVTEVEKALDKLTMQSQEQGDAIKRALILSLNTSTNFNSDLPKPIAGRAIRINDTATGFTYSNASIDDLLLQVTNIRDLVASQESVAATAATSASASASSAASALSTLQANLDGIQAALITILGA